MKKLFKHYYAVAALVLVIAALAIFAKSGKHLLSDTNNDYSVQRDITTESSISQASSNRRAAASTTSQVSKAPSQMRELLMQGISQEKREQLMARFEKWNEQDTADAIGEFKGFNDCDQFQILDTYMRAYYNEWNPSEQHWNFLKACIEEYAVDDPILDFAKSCSSYIFAMALERLLLHMHQTNPVEANLWFKKIYKSDSHSMIAGYFQENTRKIFGINCFLGIITPLPTHESPPQAIPEITVPEHQE